MQNILQEQILFVYLYIEITQTLTINKTEIMIQKGTELYKKAQSVANRIKMCASYERRNNNSSFNMFFDTFGRMLNDIQKLNVFASQIATTVEKSMNPYGFKMANVSDKQAWILACAIVENDIEVKF